MAYWLMKSEPDAYSIDDLKRDKVEPWDGIRNYQVRNMFRDKMRVGDSAFFYHSSCKVPAVVGIMTIASTAYPDPTQFDPESKYYDPKSDPDDPRWLLVDVKYKRKLKRPIPLSKLKEAPGLTGFRLLQRGNRLSVFPVEKRHWDAVLKQE
ncbi:MAG: EVE domain-containing protein [Pseudomonadota bacterium]